MPWPLLALRRCLDVWVAGQVLQKLSLRIAVMLGNQEEVDTLQTAAKAGGG